FAPSPTFRWSLPWRLTRRTSSAPGATMSRAISSPSRRSPPSPLPSPSCWGSNGRAEKPRRRRAPRPSATTRACSAIRRTRSIAATRRARCSRSIMRCCGCTGSRTRQRGRRRRSSSTIGTSSPDAGRNSGAACCATARSRTSSRRWSASTAASASGCRRTRRPSTIPPGGADEALRAATAETERANRLLGERNRQFDIALAHIRQGLALHDGDDRLLVCNSRFAEIFALPAELTRPGVARRAILDHILDRDGGGDPAAAGMHEKHLRIAAGERRQVFFQRLPGGRVIEIVHQPVPGFGAVQTFTDVTGHVRTQLALRESRRRLRERVRELEQIGERLAQQGSELTALAARLARARDEAEAAS